MLVIGGGQAGLAAGYYLRRAKVDFAILDAQPGPGGAWRHGWDSLRLFSPARYSPLPGWWMPAQPGEPFPTAGHVRRYLAVYETRFQLPVHRNAEAEQVAGVATGAVAVLSGFVLLTAAWRGVRHMTGARNARWWEREWEQVGPDWTGRRLLSAVT